MKNIIGRKVGMTSVFTSDGRYVPVTVIEAGPCVVLQRKTMEKDGYEAVALGVRRCEAQRADASPWPDATRRPGVAPKRHIREFRAGIEGVEAGATITAAEFAEGDRVDVRGISKGHGFSGGIKRWNFQRRRRRPTAR